MKKLLIFTIIGSISSGCLQFQFYKENEWVGFKAGFSYKDVQDVVTEKIAKKDQN